jgi:transcriptional regulator with XRE-family HTH domain
MDISVKRNILIPDKINNILSGLRWLIREKKGYSQEEFAAAAQLGRSYAGRVERGEQNISMQNLIQIALTLEVEIGELFPPLRELKTPHRKRLNNNL